MMKYSRESEEEADRDAVELLVAADINPEGLATFFEKLQEGRFATPDILQYLSTHPEPEERIRKIRERIGENDWEYAELLPGTEWEYIKWKCE